MRVYLAGSIFTPYERAFLDDCAARLRADGFDVFVPHEQKDLVGVDVTAEAVFAADAGGVVDSDAVLAVLDGPSVDDGTACEIGLFYGLKQRDPERKGVIGLLTVAAAAAAAGATVTLRAAARHRAARTVVTTPAPTAPAPVSVTPAVRSVPPRVPRTVIHTASAVPAAAPVATSRAPAPIASVVPAPRG